MKSVPLISVLLLLITSISAQELNPIRMGQFFEQGYGRATDDWEEEESALDIEKSDSGLVMSGWIEDESKNMTLWWIDDIGRMTQFGSYGHGGADQIGSALAMHSTGGVMMVGRQTSNYDDDQHSFIGFEDQALIKCIAPDGVELWSLLLDSSHGVSIDTHQVAVDVVNDGADNFLVLVNRMYGEGPTLDCRVVSMQFDGTVNWDETYPLDDHNVFAQKLIKSTNGQYTILANDVEGEYPVLLRFDESTGDFVTSSSYNQTYSTIAYGIDYKTYGQASSGYVLAGVQESGSDQDGFILEVANDLTGGTIKTIANTGDYPSGQELFREIATHPNGYVAIGECDNRGEGQRDVWICHLDTARDTLKHETLGGEETDYAQGAVLIPGMQSLFISGYNSSYTIEESGNAYLGGVKVDMPFGGEEECKVPRVLFVDNLIGQPIRDNITGYVNRDILNDATKEQALINFCVSNKIGYISIYRLGAIFDEYQPQLQQPDIKQDRKDAQAELNSFIQKCHNADIRVGYIADRDQHALLEVSMKHMGAFNYNVAGKFNYIQLEHEFWNTRSGDYAEILADNTFIFSDNTIDQHFTKLYSEHKDLLKDINVEKAGDGNIWNSFDYVAYFYNRAIGAVEHKNNVTPRKNKTKELANMVDAIFTTYYQEYNPTEEGLDFLSPSTSTDPQLVDYRNRLSDFGDGSVHNIIPTFSAEYYDYDISPEEFCGKGKERDSPSDPWYYYDYLGKYLDGPGYNSGYIGNDFNDVESDYVNQHNMIYQTPPAGFGNIANVNVSAFAWFQYSCVQDKTGFLDKSKVSCPAFTKYPLSIKEPEISKDLIKYINVSVYPNPTKNDVFVSLSEPKEHRVIITDQLGNVVIERDFKEAIYTLDLYELKAGIYFLQTVFENNQVSITKMIKL